MKARNKINTRAAEQYLKSHDLYQQNQQRARINPELSSFYIEIYEDFLPEPLIITVLLDSKCTKTQYHLSIEKNAKPMSATPTDKDVAMSHLLFGGNKGYTWMTSFLGLMH